MDPYIQTNEQAGLLCVFQHTILTMYEKLTLSPPQCPQAILQDVVPRWRRGADISAHYSPAGEDCHVVQHPIFPGSSQEVMM